ncbi:carbon monoxide dehydrogenase [Geomonas limicola]|uniref:Carbon monoxide dehydrogenase n=1 Tax=Geomonas limicola TaxID=2740186 RepID=A0A6V8N7K2_9BACT|nr:AAA family ATPase [Geomonas limicola]GFO67523.1 carbon monoxide dehydrogenase [Geomonas limicola]
MCDNHDHHQHDHDGEHHHHHHDHRHSDPCRGLKLAITGKGGVGKTTLASLLARVFTEDGNRVLAVDADPDANLAASLGIPPERSLGLLPIARMKELAEERTGASGGYGTLFKLNPKVADLPAKFCLEHDGVRFLWMGTLEKGGSGCACPESTLVKRLMGQLLLEKDEVVILDMEAGIEHLGRRTAESVHALVVVVEPGQRSIQTAYQIMELAADLGIAQVFVVGSKVRDAGDRRLIEDAFSEGRLLGHLSFSEEIRRADRENLAPGSTAATSLDEVRLLKDRLAERLGH